MPALLNPDDDNDSDRFDNYLDELFGYPFETEDLGEHQNPDGIRYWDDLTEEEQANVHINPDDTRY